MTPQPKIPGLFPLKGWRWGKAATHLPGSHCYLEPQGLLWTHPSVQRPPTNKRSPAPASAGPPTLQSQNNDCNPLPVSQSETLSGSQLFSSFSLQNGGPNTTWELEDRWLRTFSCFFFSNSNIGTNQEQSPIWAILNKMILPVLGL